jgi:chromosome segregation ATPase
VQKEKFQDRMRELKEGEDSIRKLIENLDAKKDNALQTTFKMVSKHFSDVFKSIVTGGEGGLIMKTKDVQVSILAARSCRVLLACSPPCVHRVGSRAWRRL